METFSEEIDGPGSLIGILFNLVKKMDKAIDQFQKDFDQDFELNELNQVLGDRYEIGILITDTFVDFKKCNEKTRGLGDSIDL